jgi:hypothetical protein
MLVFAKVSAVEYVQYLVAFRIIWRPVMYQ